LVVSRLSSHSRLLDLVMEYYISISSVFSFSSLGGLLAGS
jgi:hypothetical protein